MSDTPELVFETELDAPPEQVWRALTVPEYLDRWLQPPVDANLSIEAVDGNSQLTYRLSERNQDSLITFEISPSETGGTLFTVTHVPVAANSNERATSPLMLAA